MGPIYVNYWGICCYITLLLTPVSMAVTEMEKLGYLNTIIFLSIKCHLGQPSIVVFLFLFYANCVFFLLRENICYKFTLFELCV